MSELILLQELPIAKAGSQVITSEDGGIFRKFAGTWQLVAKVAPEELPKFVGEKPQPKPIKELTGDAWVEAFKERMGWNTKPLNVPMENEQQMNAPMPSDPNVNSVTNN